MRPSKVSPYTVRQNESASSIEVDRSLSQQSSEEVGFAQILSGLVRHPSVIAFHGFLSAGGCTISKSALPWL
jgi:hypothetical protein